MRLPVWASPLNRRIARLERELLACLSELWPEDLDGLIPHGLATPRDADTPGRPYVDASIRRLLTRWPEDELGALAADMYFSPASWKRPYEAVAHARTLGVLVAILAACVERFPPRDIHRRLEARLDRIFRHSSAPILGVGYPSDGYLVPRVEHCLRLLAAQPPTPENLSLIERLVRGDFDRVPPRVLVGYRPPSAYQYHGLAMRQHLAPLLERLHDHGRLDYALFRQAAEHLPQLLASASAREPLDGLPNDFHDRVSPAFGEVVLGWCDQLAWELAREFEQGATEERCALFKQLRGLRGGRYLVQAARLHQRHQLGKLSVEGHELRNTLEAVVIHLARSARCEPPEDAAYRQAVAGLRAVPAAIVQQVLPVGTHGRALLCEALGWQAALPLIEELARTARLAGSSYRWERDVRNSPDVTLGVVDVAAAQGALAQAGPKLARQVFGLFRSAQIGAGNAIQLFEALAGWNRAKIEAGFAGRNQLAVKAYGLLPLERGEEEALERYLALRRFAHESRQFGPQRQASEQAAVQVALANLAQVAGYADRTRLEWAMEARLGGEPETSPRSWEIDGYRLELALDGPDPELAVWSGERRLKSVPAAVRKSPAYAEVKEASDRLRGQASRLRATLEELMATGEPLGPDDLARLARLPVAAALLAGLILRADDGATGLCDPAGPALSALDGTLVPVAGPVRIAHPYHLYQAGALAAWQQEIVRRRVVQPFKQAFRELYLLTPAEEATRTYSNRFAGHALDPGVATRLFQARGWQLAPDEVAMPGKVFPAHGLEAVFEFPDAGHYLAETDVVTSGRIYVVPHPPRPEAWSEPDEGRLPWSEVPPLLFSELMRDADLVCAVAQHEGGARLSEESYQRRGELVTALLDDLGLPGVSVEGHFARVQGKLARYRVHLGSAAIHIEPGNYLCIVPDRWGQGGARGRHPDALYLPFADEGDAKVREVISKVLLLANDDKIKDQTILRQLRRR